MDMHMRQTGNPQNEGVHYDHEKGMYVFDVDPVTGDPISKEVQNAPLTQEEADPIIEPDDDIDVNVKPKTISKWVIAAGLIGGFILLNR